MLVLKELNETLQDHFLAEPQKAYLAKGAVASIQAGLETLASLGFRYDLAPVDHQSGVEEFPKMLYHDGAPFEMTVETKDAEDKALTEGWRAAQVAQPVEALSPASGEVPNA